MSTDMYLQCDSHDPEIRSDEVGSGTHHLPDIRRAIRERDEFLEGIAGLEKAGLSFWDIDFIDSHERARAFFIKAHPHCELSIWDEYHRFYSMEDTVEEKPLGVGTVLGKIMSIEDNEEGMVVKFGDLTPEGERVLRRMNNL